VLITYFESKSRETCPEALGSVFRVCYVEGNPPETNGGGGSVYITS